MTSMNEIKIGIVFFIANLLSASIFWKRAAPYHPLVRPVLLMGKYCAGIMRQSYFGGSAMKVDNFDAYQRESRKTWNLIHTDHPIVYPTLGLVNEAGELAGKVKKIFRDKEGKISEEDRQALKYELGDVLWYMAQIATELDISLEEVAQANLEKLFSRLERGKIKGEGDYR
jgi:NTP pyrophosphatase (non-canonical NTP hydrolase)